MQQMLADMSVSMVYYLNNLTLDTVLSLLADFNGF